MRTYEEMKAIALSNPVVRAEFDRIEREEMPMLDAILKARKEANLTQEQVAKRMGVSTPVVSRLESALISGKHSPPSPRLSGMPRRWVSGWIFGLLDLEKYPYSLKCKHETQSLCGNQHRQHIDSST